MGWEMHITRAECWSESETQPIGSEEWVQLVSHDDELAFDRRNGEFHAIWKGQETCWLEWSDGAITTTSPAEPLYCKMLEIASALKAQVRDDDDRLYLLPGDLLNPSWAIPKAKLSLMQKITGFFKK
ncbi:hypothetical protein [Kosakonia sacchari]|uniref:Uncharacterized protein n=1 Tax=Kosakonia sacchari TaxID=1158459 RepID=A0A1G4YAC4_9ENTR|nr:hypothetical protein [Kosakonia sacchari]AHJ76155.1 hypothetical protein C813_16660 [Kosakonia sacchari SP1]NUL37996.1 hypothetical protein [Kosakonia sacchari]SCX50426.1 hypothetical protein SAMN02927897_02249 [Kosakonia sacchari]